MTGTITAGLGIVEGASFVPRFVLDRLAEGPIDGPQRLRVDGALLLSDVVGFTTFTESRAQEDGLEELVATCERYFAAATSAVLAHGGDILTFAGDSLLAWWPSEPETGLGGATEAAARAGVAMLEATGGELGTRIGVAAGEMHLGLAGGTGERWELVPSGPAVADAVACEAAASAGAVLLSRTAADALGSAVRVRRREDGRAELIAVPERETATTAPMSRTDPAADPAEPALIAPFVPPAVARAGAEDAGWLSEVRHVTAVMASLAAEEASEEAFARQHGALAAFGAIVARYEATPNVQFDGKGLTCSAVFGLPPHAHLDDVDRALRAALELSEAFIEHGFAGGVGVSRGRICCGLIGSRGRRHYMLFGDAINVASRLSMLAEGEVRIDEATVESASRHSAVELERRPPLALRNRREPVRVHRLVALRRAVAAGPRIVGRAAERTELADAIGRLSRGEAVPPILICGELGIGKSTLVADAAEAADAAGLTVDTVIAEPVEQGSAYHAVRPLFARRLAGVGEGAELAAAVGLGAREQRLLPLLNPFLDRPLPETATTAGLTGEARADQLHRLLVRALVRNTVARPCVIIVEDVQWLDSMSWSLLRRIATDVPHTLVVATERTAESETGERTFEGARELRLGPLTVEETAELVRDRLHVPAVSPAILALILDRVGGHPFFCEAILESMVESGSLQVTREGAILAADAGLSVPVTVEAALLSRLDRLSHAQGLALKAAAVVGQRFTVAEVAAAHPLDAAAETMDELVALELLAPESDLAYRFRHRIIQQVAHDLLTAGQRREMHAAVALHLESRPAAAPETLAHHWLAAEQPERAVAHLEAAGHHALHHGAFADAVTLLERAIAASPVAGPERRALQEKALADAHYFLGDLSHGQALLEQALERLGYPSGRSLPRQLASLARLAARELWPAPRRSRAGDSPEVLRVASDGMRRLVQIGYLHGTSSVETARLALAGRDLAERAGPSPELARSLANVAVLSAVSGFPRHGERLARRAVALADGSMAAAYAWNVTAIMYAGLGRFTESVAASQQALGCFGVTGDFQIEADLWQTRAAIDLHRGALDDADRAWRRTAELAERTGSPLGLCLSLLDRAQSELSRGLPEAAAESLGRALELPLPVADAGTTLERCATAAWLRLDQGRHAEAIREADAALAVLASRLPLEWVWVEFGAVAVEVLLDLRSRSRVDVPRAGLDRRIARGVRILRRIAFSFPAGWPRVETVTAAVALADGNERRAARHLARARARVAAPDRSLDRARVAVVEARLAGDPAERRRMLEDAQTMFTALGQHREAHRAAEAAERR